MTQHISMGLGIILDNFSLTLPEDYVWPGRTQSVRVMMHVIAKY